jgi:hypothetical protein
MMKKLFSTLCIAGTALGMAACDTSSEGFRDTAPYSAERTAGSTPGYDSSGKQHAGGETREVESAEPVFDKKMRK